MTAASRADVFDTDVAIVGAGPVGTLLAILLGQRGKRVTLIERWTTHYPLPRAVTYDHEIARIFATLGIHSENDPAINFHDELYYWKNRDGQDIQIVDWQSQSASGWRVRYWFNQPLMEDRLLAIAATMPNITLLRGWQGIGLEQDADGVTLSLQRNPEEVGTNGDRRSLRARFVAGTDGANSFVRESLGIENEDRGYFFDWLILDMIPHFDYLAARGDDPALWQLCDPARPTTIVPGGPGPVPGGPLRRRWEFMVLPGESAHDLQKPEQAWELLKPWGLTPDNADLERSAVYRFQARWAKQWNKGRCVIGGDAAHLMPPFAGEGMCAGVRDAVAMAWRNDCPQIVVATTYAGSGVTPILGQTENGLKTTLREARVLPEVVIYDLDLTLGLPVAMSVTSGLNAMAHAVEGVYAQDRSPIASMMAVEGLRALRDALPVIAGDPRNAVARGQALYGSWLCGTVLGTVGMALHHKLCHTLGGSFDLPHAETHAVMLPHTAAFNALAAKAELQPLADLFSGQIGPGLWDFANSLGAPMALRDLGLAEADLDRATDLAVKYPCWNPRPIARAPLRSLLQLAWEGARPE